MAGLHGIRNVGDFFSQHYLDQLLDRDLKELLDAWAEREKAGRGQAPPQRLAKLASVYFRQAALAAEETSERRRFGCAREFHAHLLEALGYARAPDVHVLEGGEHVPLVARVDHERKPFLWIVEAPFGRAESEASTEEDDSPFRARILPEQLPEAPGGTRADNDGAGESPQATALRWGELFDGPLFHGDEPARWVLFLAGEDAFLIDRHKWPQGKYLHFELATLFGRKDMAALRAMAAILHRDALIPEGGTSLLDRLDQESHKHAFAVSTDLKWGVQRSVERLANEALYYRRTVLKKALFDDSIDPTALSRECIVYLYRLLFLFYVEARGGDLGIVPMAADAYRLGYSLEALRDLEHVPLLSADAREGHYLHESLKKLFELVQRGHDAAPNGSPVTVAVHGTFDLCGLGSPLFDPTATPVLSSVRLRNVVLQQVLQDLSLSRPKAGKERGRISYTQLGINQLGAVYERLLSYTGLFAKEKLYEVRAASEVKDEDARTYFVPESKIGDYKEEEKVRDDAGRPIAHAKGTFLFRLAGRDREKNASYYTPEVLTKCLTKYTLKVRLGEPLMQPRPGEQQRTSNETQKPLTADEILNLTICEPAMGSGAFLNEAVNQLAHKYLEKKQAELGQTIPADQYQREWAKVKYHFVAHQVYGVDLNPLAAELGKVSLWLNSLVPCVPPPYLEPRIGVGNSLIGARREVFLADKLMGRGRRGEAAPWLKEVPVRVPLGPGGFQPRPEGSVYHFLLPDEGMTTYADDAVVKDLLPDEAQALRNWRTALCAPLSSAEVEQLVAISDRVDELWKVHVANRRELLRQLRQPIALWGQSGSAASDTEQSWRTEADCKALALPLEEAAGAGNILRAVMDYWGALWFWPLIEAGSAPKRTEWWADVESILLGQGLKARGERGRVLRAVTANQRFFHWELEFAEAFCERGGLDVFLGNPPWIKLEWKEAGILSDLDPSLLVRGLSATEIAEKRSTVLGATSSTPAYLQELENAQASAVFVGAKQNYAIMAGVQANVYKCFMVTAARNSSPSGVSGLLHQPGIFNDAHGGPLREHVYERLRFTAGFQNQLKLFPDIGNARPYCFSVLGRATKPHFLVFNGGLHPRTLDDSLMHDGRGPVPIGRTDSGERDLRGHRSRILHVGLESLASFAKLYDPPLTPPAQARLPTAYCQEILNATAALGLSPQTLAHLGDQFVCIQHWNERARQGDGTIRKVSRIPAEPETWVVSGPHIHVANPLYKAPNKDCSSHRDYTPIDLCQATDDYLPRTNFIPGCAKDRYRELSPRCHGRPVTEFYRYAHRRRLDPKGERTLLPAIIPPGPAHIDQVLSVILDGNARMVAFAGLAAAIPIDYFVRSTGKSDARNELLAQLPLPEPSECIAIVHRALRLNCVTKFYAALWTEVATAAIGQDGFAKVDGRLGSWRNLTGTWRWESALRTPYERRQALVELDALAAIALGLSSEDLGVIYRMDFQVSQQYERETFYDQRGKIVFTVNKGLSGVGFKRPQWDEIKDARKGDKLPDWAHDAGGPFVPPFDACDREQDMAQAYQHFSRLLGKSEPPSARRDRLQKTSAPPHARPAANDPSVPIAKPRRASKKAG
jgi:hypothetical protein